ncbi:MAG: hypothetical protein AB7S26_32310 [Sandaracinaceae bacterium]
MLRACALIGAGLLTLGCDVYHPEAFFDAGVDAGPRLDAGFDAGRPDAGRPDGGPPDAGPACVLEHVPSRPLEADSGDQIISFALRDVILDQRMTVWSDIGYDHDGECTEMVGQGTCLSRGGLPQLDGPGGVDNVGGRQVLSLLAERYPGVQDNARAEQMAGRHIVFVHVSGWNGTDEDPRVTAWFAQGLDAAPEGGAIGDPLRWDGHDQFELSSADFEGGDPLRPLIADDLGYVADRRLVLNVPDGRPILLPWDDDRALVLRLTDAFLTGTISADATRLDDVTITGRWAVIDIQAVFTQLGLCPGTSERANADVLLAQFPDIRSDPATDGLGAMCDAYSIAVGFTGYRGIFASIGMAPSPVDICP